MGGSRKERGTRHAWWSDQEIETTWEIKWKDESGKEGWDAWDVIRSR